ncbi:hypothetical protein [Thalassobaculum sp.]
MGDVAELFEFMPDSLEANGGKSGAERKDQQNGRETREYPGSDFPSSG